MSEQRGLCLCPQVVSGWQPKVAGLRVGVLAGWSAVSASCVLVPSSLILFEEASHHAWLLPSEVHSHSLPPSLMPPSAFVVPSLFWPTSCRSCPNLALAFKPSLPASTPSPRRPCLLPPAPTPTRRPGCWRSPPCPGRRCGRGPAALRRWGGPRRRGRRPSVAAGGSPSATTGWALVAVATAAAATAAAATTVVGAMAAAAAAAVAAAACGAAAAPPGVGAKIPQRRPGEGGGRDSYGRRVSPQAPFFVCVPFSGERMWASPCLCLVRFLLLLFSYLEGGAHRRRAPSPPLPAKRID